MDYGYGYGCGAPSVLRSECHWCVVCGALWCSAVSSIYQPADLLKYVCILTYYNDRTQTNVITIVIVHSII